MGYSVRQEKNRWQFCSSVGFLKLPKTPTLFLELAFRAAGFFSSFFTSFFHDYAPQYLVFECLTISSVLAFAQSVTGGEIVDKNSDSSCQKCRENVPEIRPKQVRLSEKSDKSDSICHELKVVLTQLESVPIKFRQSYQMKSDTSTRDTSTIR